MITSNYFEVVHPFTGVELVETLKASHSALYHLCEFLDSKSKRFVGLNFDEVSLSDYHRVKSLIDLIKSSVCEVEEIIDHNLFA